MKSIIIENISKTYDQEEIKALKGISFEVEQGELFGLIGPDGAGKTTLFRILTTLLLADSGSAAVDGLEVMSAYKEIRKRIGYMPGRFSLYQDLSVGENLDLFASLFGTSVAENYDLIRDIYVHIEPFKKRRAGQLSGGMKQKLALCCALIHRPTVLFLDEPTTGVDVVSRQEFWEMLKRLKEQGITILASTPYMDEATRCDRIALIQSGEILSIDTPRGIVEKYRGNLYAVKSTNIGRLIHDMQDAVNIRSCYAFGEFLHVSFEWDNAAAHRELDEYLKDKGHSDIVFRQITPGVEDCFINLMNK